MIIAAVLFGYFGFMSGLTPFNQAGQYVLFFEVLIWTLRVGAIGFAISVVLTFVTPLFGGLLYALVGVLTSTGLVVVGVWDLLDPNAAALSPFFAFLFAAFNGWGSIVTLRGVWPYLKAKMNQPGRDSFGLPPDA